jgi:hypothetical protein
VYRALAFVLLMLGLVAGGATVSAQATPDASPSLLAGFGYPELAVTTDGATYDAPESIPAGRYVLTATNSGAEGTEADLVFLPPDQTIDTLIAAMAAPEPTPWLFHIVFAGGSIIPAGQTMHTVVDLTPGSWVVMSTGNPTPEPRTLTVTEAEGTPATATDPVAGVVAQVQEYSIILPENIPAGPQVWSVENTGAQPHFVEIISVPEGTTVPGIMAALGMADPPAEGPADLSAAVGHGGLSTLSVGLTGYVEMDLTPGTYAAFCFIPDIEAGVPHAAMGMITVFTVA